MHNDPLILVAAIAVAGIAGQWLGWRFKVPAIIPLLLIGIVLGPLAGAVDPHQSFGPLMETMVGLAVAIIVFEGGLNLNLRELRSTSGGVLRLVALAIPLNMLFSALAVHYLAGLNWTISVLIGAILVVTGPTVILPLLRQSKLERRSATFLKWEAIVNDPIGATLTLLILSYLLLSTSMSGADAIWTLTWRTFVGALVASALGAAVPFALRWMFRHNLVPEYLKTPMLLSGVIAVYSAGNAFQPETGLIGATLFGVVLANIEVTGLQQLTRFKESLAIFLVSGIFITLTADIDRETIANISTPLILTTLAILFVARPMAIYLATISTNMNWRERLLVGWIGPRGVVAAAIAGIAAERLGEAGYPDAELILPLVFMIIASTVLLHGFSLSPLARWLKLASSNTGGLIIIGASPWSIGLARLLCQLDENVLIVDRSIDALRPARAEGLPTLRLDILSTIGEELADLQDCDCLLAVTADDAYNSLVCTRFANEIGQERVYQLPPEDVTARNLPAREWRGKFIGEEGVTLSEWLERTQDSAGFTVATLDEDMPLEAEDEYGWLVAILKSNGMLKFYSAEHGNNGSKGDRIIRLSKQVRTIPQASAKWRWPFALLSGFSR